MSSISYITESYHEFNGSNKNVYLLWYDDEPNKLETFLMLYFPFISMQKYFRVRDKIEFSFGYYGTESSISLNDLILVLSED